jgi:Domain of unknown function (DUF1707)/Cell wall-active antibiotics response 4TMS YvqF
VGGELSDRVSDADRETTVLSLREDLLAGRLTLDEFSERVELAYRARTGHDLVHAREELPVTTGEGVDSRRKPTRLTGALFGHVVKRGRLRLRRRTVVVSAFADVDFDLREAGIDGPETSVTVLLAFGNVDLYVPEGVAVDVRGVTVFGHRREWGRDVSYRDGPMIHVRTLGCFATVDIWRVPHQMHGTYSEIIKLLREQQRALPE